MSTRGRWLTVGGVAAIGTAAVLRARRGRRTIAAIAQQGRTGRNAQLATLGLQVGATYASSSARKLFASAERRVELDRERCLLYTSPSPRDS